MGRRWGCWRICIGRRRRSFRRGRGREGGRRGASGGGRGRECFNNPRVSYLTTLLPIEFFSSISFPVSVSPITHEYCLNMVETLHAPSYHPGGLNRHTRRCAPSFHALKRSLPSATNSSRSIRHIFPPHLHDTRRQLSYISSPSLQKFF